MRLGLVVEPAPAAGLLASLTGQATAAEEAGLDLVCLMPWEGGPGALATAAALSGSTSVVRLAAVVPSGAHPLQIAEEATVADNCSNGRLVLVLRDERGDAELLGETADILLAATAARPFSHQGHRWTIPAGRPENSDLERRLRVTPAPVQLELPIWLSGGGAAAVARERGLSHLSESGDEPKDEWASTQELLGALARRLRRPALRILDASATGEFDDDGLVTALRDERERWGLDLAIVRVPPWLQDPARARVIDGLARRVRPRVQLDVLPDGLESHWKATLAGREEEEPMR
jgi:alkanesulfonate monooxygenase SsuD/methylene tetrahydromethanopterin reductase-like flavin-dependent oxidoreductase (luciferase family)